MVRTMSGEIVTEQSDEHVVVAALSDKEQFAVLIERYTARLLRYLTRLGVRTHEDREDILQEAFIKAYRNLNGFDTDLSFSSWMYRIVHNEAMSFFRKRSVRPEGSLVEDSETALHYIQSELDTAHDAEQRLNAEHLSQALARLDGKYRDVVVLRFFEDRDYADISDILQIPMGSVATLLHRAKKALARELAHIR
jgi:RNA polymerase sigma-70 factor (ECF subfamily)